MGNRVLTVVGKALVLIIFAYFVLLRLLTSDAVNLLHVTYTWAIYRFIEQIIEGKGRTNIKQDL